MSVEDCKQSRKCTVLAFFFRASKFCICCTYYNLKGINTKEKAGVLALIGVLPSCLAGRKGWRRNICTVIVMEVLNRRSVLAAQMQANLISSCWRTALYSNNFTVLLVMQEPLESFFGQCCQKSTFGLHS
jgi:hypothetical protein